MYGMVRYGMFNTNVPRRCFPFWLDCPDKIVKSKCEVYRDCLFKNECFKQWRSRNSIRATEEQINEW